MLIYLKGITSVQLEHLLDFIYNGEASFGREELKEFLDTVKELQVNGFVGDVFGVGGTVESGPEPYKNEKEEIQENKDTNTEENGTGEILETSTDNYFVDGIFNPKNIDTNHIEANSDLDLKIMEMMGKSDGLWECKICGRTAESRGHIREHVETHIEGMTHPCHICDKNFSNRPGLRKHIYHVHSELFTCELCGKTEMNRRTFFNHKMSKQHRKLSGQIA